MNPHTIFLCTLLTFSLSIYGVSSGVTYTVVNEAANTPGGQKFTKLIGIPYTKEIMPKIHMFILNTILQQTNPADRKPIDTVEIFIRDVKGYEALTDINKINVSAVYLDLYQGDATRGDLKWEFTSLLYHEMTHVFQWTCVHTTRCNQKLIEGIADYTILKANYYPPPFAKPGTGDKWDQGYDFTARFLEYCDTLTPSFAAKLNKMMRYTYDDSYFKNLTGKPVQQLWKEYKAKYGQPV
ncbi:uncharacterized protein [Rutidosis leptorrhynchoides]|uniref:uncharacterized protein n=1 Tax=Rutidosis leptorrhynchoides TaxID=125765 RepID=UPI003A9A127E